MIKHSSEQPVQRANIELTSDQLLLLNHSNNGHSV